MADVTSELIHEGLNQIPSDIAGLKDAAHQTNAQLNALQTHMIAMQQDSQNIYSILVRHDAGLERIERRLEIVEVV